MKNTAMIRLILIGLLFVSCNSSNVQTGSLTKGNPDNTYLDSCDIYCCGD